MSRNNNGTFAKGNKEAVGHGRPARRVEASYLVSMTKAVSEDDWCQIVSKAVEQSKEGDHRAREWLSHYLLGTSDPTQNRPTLARAHAVDPETAIDSEEKRIRHDMAIDGLLY